MRAVTLGGSRAQGTHGPDSDWDLAVYYRGAFAPDDLRALGWAGEVSEIGAWGGGVFNGGAWLTIDERRVDVHYRDLDVVEHEVTEAEAGRFGVEPLMFHLAGIPTYLVVAELAINEVLRGELPRPAYPEALRATAPERWYGAATATLAYAKAGHAPKGALTQVAGAIALAATQAAHAVLAARAEWVTNEKGLVRRAGLGGIDDVRLATARRCSPESYRQPGTGDATRRARSSLHALDDTGRLTPRHTERPAALRDELAEHRARVGRHGPELPLAG